MGNGMAKPHINWGEETIPYIRTLSAK